MREELRKIFEEDRIRRDNIGKAKEMTIAQFQLHSPYEFDRDEIRPLQEIILKLIGLHSLSYNWAKKYGEYVQDLELQEKLARMVKYVDFLTYDLGAERENLTPSDRVRVDKVLDIAAARGWTQGAVHGNASPQRPGKSPVVEPPTAGAETPAWILKRPKRFQGYAKPLYDFLKAEHDAGKPRPKAHDVLEAWSRTRPLDIGQVTSNSFDYAGADGKTKTAELAAIGKTIGRMTQ